MKLEKKKKKIKQANIGRPCQRCIKRSIGHLCHDEVKTPGSSGGVKKMVKKPTSSSETLNTMPVQPQQLQGILFFSSKVLYLILVCKATPSNLGGLPLQFFGQVGSGQLTFASELMGNEISVIRYTVAK